MKKDINIYIHLPGEEDREFVFKAIEKKGGITIYPGTRNHETRERYRNLVYQNGESNITGNSTSKSSFKTAVSGRECYIAPNKEIFVEAIFNLKDNGVLDNFLI